VSSGEGEDASGIVGVKQNIALEGIHHLIQEILFGYNEIKEWQCRGDNNILVMGSTR